jgi:hypothetical protein
MDSPANIIIFGAGAILAMGGCIGAFRPTEWHELNEAFMQSVGFPPGMTSRPRTIRKWGRFNLAAGATLMIISLARVLF